MQNKESSSSSKKRRRTRKSRSSILSQKDIEKQVVDLLVKADEAIRNDMDMAQKYALRAKKIQMRTRIKFPPQWKKRFCKHCKSFLSPGINCRVRLSSTNKVIAIKCFQCDKYTRIPYYRRMEEKNERKNQ